MWGVGVWGVGEGVWVFGCVGLGLGVGVCVGGCVAVCLGVGWCVRACVHVGIMGVGIFALS